MLLWKVQRLKNRQAYLESGSRKQRTHRLITRGAAIESIAPQTKELSLVTVFLLPGNTGVVLCGRPDEMLRLRQIQNAFHEGIKFRFG